MAPSQLKNYAGVQTIPSQEWIRSGGRLASEGEGGREALRELLPYVAHGWAPEFIHGQGYYCAVRALARAFINAVNFHLPQYGDLPPELSGQRLLERMVSNKHKRWRGNMEQMVLSFRDFDFPTFSKSGDYFSVDDIRYLLHYINEQRWLPIRFRLGVIIEWPRTQQNKTTVRRTTIELYPPLSHTNPHDPVMWLHNINNTHWESIGPRPSSKGLELFAELGLENAAKQVVEQGLYRVTKASQVIPDIPRNPECPRLKDHSFIYGHPKDAPLPEDWKEKNGFFFGMTPRSKAHDDYAKRPKLEGEEGYISRGSVLKIDTFPVSSVYLDGKGARYRKLVVRDEQNNNRREYVPVNGDNLDGINNEYAAPAKDVPISPERTEQPEPTIPPSPDYQTEVQQAATVSPRKRPASYGDDDTSTLPSPPKKQKKDWLAGTAIPSRLVADQGGPLPRGQSSEIKPPVHAPISGSRVRMWRALVDSRLNGEDCHYPLDYRVNDLLLSIESVPNQPTEPFFARTQDLREGQVNPAGLKEVYPLPFGLGEEILAPAVPMERMTYLAKGEAFIESLMKRAGVDPNTVHIDDIIRQIIDFRRRNGFPIAFWRGRDETAFPEEKPPMVNRYVRMVNSNSKNFHPDKFYDTAFIWLEETSRSWRETKKDWVFYAHDKNWGLRVKKQKTKDDLKREDSKIGRELFAPGGVYPPPIIYVQPSLMNRIVGPIWGRGPNPGKDSRLTWQQKYDVQLYHVRQLHWDNENTRPRPAIARNPQKVNILRGQWGLQKTLAFPMGEKLWMEAPLGVEPYHVWSGWVTDDIFKVLKKGLVYPHNVRELTVSEKYMSTSRRLFEMRMEQQRKEKHEARAARVAAKRTGKYVDDSGPVPQVRRVKKLDFTPLRMSTIASPPKTQAPEPGVWFGGRKKPTNKAELDEEKEKEEKRHKRLSDRAMASGDTEALDAETKRHTDFMKAIMQLSGVFKSTRVFADLTLTDPRDKDIEMPDRPVTPPDRQLPTTNRVKDLLDRSPESWRNPKTGKIRSVKDFRRMQTIYFQPTRRQPGKSRSPPKSPERRRKTPPKSPEKRRRSPKSPKTSPSKTRRR